MTYDELKVGRVYFYGPYEFIIIRNINKSGFSYTFVHFDLSTNASEPLRIKEEDVSYEVMTSRLINHLKTFSEMKRNQSERFEKDVIYFLFKLSRK